MAKKSVPHISSWTVIKEEFAGIWEPFGEDHIKGVYPLMEVTRAQNINGEMHVATILERGKPIHFYASESNMGLFLKNKFLLETLFAAQKAAKHTLPSPACRPVVNLFEEHDRQMGRKK